MAGQIILYSISITVSGGVGSVNTTTDNGFQSWKYGGLIRNIFVKSPQSGDTFDFKITSPNSNDVFERKGITSRLSENTNFCIRGTHTVKIQNASRDGTYRLEFGFEEGKG